MLPQRPENRSISLDTPSPSSKCQWAPRRAEGLFEPRQALLDLGLGFHESEVADTSTVQVDLEGSLDPAVAGPLRVQVQLNVMPAIQALAQLVGDPRYSGLQVRIGLHRRELRHVDEYGHRHTVMFSDIEKTCHGLNNERVDIARTVAVQLVIYGQDEVTVGRQDEAAFIGARGS